MTVFRSTGGPQSPAPLPSPALPAVPVSLRHGATTRACTCSAMPRPGEAAAHREARDRDQRDGRAPQVAPPYAESEPPSSFEKPYCSATRCGTTTSVVTLGTPSCVSAVDRQVPLIPATATIIVAGIVASMPYRIKS